MLMLCIMFIYARYGVGSLAGALEAEQYGGEAMFGLGVSFCGQMSTNMQKNTR